MRNEAKKIKRFRFYPSYLFWAQDIWLSKMSECGFHLVDYGLFTYIFEIGQPEHKKYFSYVVARVGDGYFDISLRFPMITESYGVPRYLSYLNRNNRKARIIVELETNIIKKKREGFKELVLTRNKLYVLNALRTIGVFALLGLLYILFGAQEHLRV